MNKYLLLVVFLTPSLVGCQKDDFVVSIEEVPSLLLSDKNCFELSGLGKQQSMVFYEGKAFFVNGNKCNIYDLGSLKKEESFALPCEGYRVPHANTICLGSQLYSNNSVIPVMYVSAWDGDKQSFVYDIVKTNGSIQASLVQIINPGGVSREIIGSGYLDWVIDAEGGYLYSIAYHLQESSLQREGNYTHVTAFSLPPLSEKVVNLTDDDVLFSFSTPVMTIFQDKLFQEGHIFVVAGDSGYGEEYCPRLYDIDVTQRQMKETVIPIVGEPEGFCLYEGKKWMNLNGSSLVYDLDNLILRP